MHGPCVMHACMQGFGVSLAFLLLCCSAHIKQCWQHYEGPFAEEIPVLSIMGGYNLACMG
jgi:hypothetical protein